MGWYRVLTPAPVRMCIKLVLQAQPPGSFSSDSRVQLEKRKGWDDSFAAGVGCRRQGDSSASEDVSLASRGAS